MTIIYFLENKASNIDRFKFLLIFMALATLLIAIIQHLKEIYYKPWKKNKVLSRTPFKEFLDKGFSKEENYLKGQIDGYNLVVGVEWEFFQNRPEYYFKILFNPFVNRRLLNQKECIKLNEDFNQIKSHFTLNSIVKYYGQRKLFLRTEYKDIISDIKKSIDFLKVKNFDPISFSEWKTHIEKIKRHAETFSYQ